MIPDNLEGAKRFFGRLPPPPPGRNIQFTMKPTRQCHGCHGYNDADHNEIPLGANKCPLPHDDRCPGGIVAGKDSKGSEWRACKEGYRGPDDRGSDFSDSSDEESENEHIENEIDYLDYPKLDKIHALPNTSGATSPTCTTSVSGAHSLLTQSSSTATVSSAQQAPLLSTSHESSLVQEKADLENLRKVRETLEQQAQLVEQQKEKAALEELRRERVGLEEQEQLFQQQKISAERVELQRQLQAERARIEKLKKSSGALPSSQSHFVEQLKKQNQAAAPLTHDFQSHYTGPDIKQIRKTKGLRRGVEKRVQTVRGDIPSLGHRQTAGQLHTATQSDRNLGARKKVPATSQSKTPLEQEFEEFRRWKEMNTKAASQSESESDASPPRVATAQRRRAKGHAQVQDPITEPSSSSEDETGQTMVLVYRRDEFGVKYRTYEPVQVDDQAVQYAWITDPNTGRAYKQAVQSKPPPNKHTQVHTAASSHQQAPRHLDHRIESGTPEYGYRRGMRSPVSNRRQHNERVPGIVPLEDKDGKSVDSKTTTILDWAKNCPVTYAEKIKYDEMNLPIWIWAYVSEILATRTGMAPDMAKGELEARLQHLLCVLQVALVNSEKTDFNSKGWSIASIYAKRIQQKLDRGLDTWSDFKRFGHDPHPSEMFSAKTEADRKIPFKKKDEKPDKGGKRMMCTTWNNFEVERKCQYLLDNPSATRCIRRHDCSYCLEKNHGTFYHQRRFCAKRRAAGDE